MIQDLKITKRIYDILDSADEAALLTEVVVTAAEIALKEGWDSSKESMDSRILNIMETAAKEWEVI